MELIDFLVLTLSWICFLLVCSVLFCFVCLFVSVVDRYIEIYSTVTVTQKVYCEASQFAIASQIIEAHWDVQT